MRDCALPLVGVGSGWVNLEKAIYGICLLAFVEEGSCSAYVSKKSVCNLKMQQSIEQRYADKFCARLRKSLSSTQKQNDRAANGILRSPRNRKKLACSNPRSKQC